MEHQLGLMLNTLHMLFLPGIQKESDHHPTYRAVDEACRTKGPAQGHMTLVCGSDSPAPAVPGVHTLPLTPIPLPQGEVVWGFALLLLLPPYESPSSRESCPHCLVHQGVTWGSFFSSTFTSKHFSIPQSLHTQCPHQWNGQSWPCCERQESSGSHQSTELLCTL